MPTTATPGTDVASVTSSSGRISSGRTSSHFSHDAAGRSSLDVGISRMKKREYDLSAFISRGASLSFELDNSLSNAELCSWSHRTQKRMSTEARNRGEAPFGLFECHGLDGRPARARPLDPGSMPRPAGHRSSTPSLRCRAPSRPSTIVLTHHHFDPFVRLVTSTRVDPSSLPSSGHQTALPDAPRSRRARPLSRPSLIQMAHPNEDAESPPRTRRRIDPANLPSSGDVAGTVDRPIGESRTTYLRYLPCSCRSSISLAHPDERTESPPRTGCVDPASLPPRGDATNAVNSSIGESRAIYLRHHPGSYRSTISLAHPDGHDAPSSSRPKVDPASLPASGKPYYLYTPVTYVERVRRCEDEDPAASAGQQDIDEKDRTQLCVHEALRSLFRNQATVT